MKKNQNSPVLELLANIRLGEKQSYKNVTIYPIEHTQTQSTDYISLTEAIENDLVEVVEKDINGSVSELKVRNKSENQVLIVDGEEVMGAKQNRIVNTSVLIQKMAEIIIPVSCTEAGRWSYQSRDFKPSDNIALASTRSKKTESVSYCLSSTGGYKSDQGAIWNDISDNLIESDVHSTTSAMNDLFAAKAEEVNDQIKDFVKDENQSGLIVLIDNQVIGMEYLSSPKVYKQMHSKIIKSYISQMDIIQKSTKVAATNNSLTQFLLEMVLTSKIEEYKSPGNGFDLRIETDKTTGNALVHDGEVLHMACFSKKLNK